MQMNIVNRKRIDDVDANFLPSDIPYVFTLPAAAHIEFYVGESRDWARQFLLINLSCVFRNFSLYVSIETQPLKQHINTAGTRREIRLAYFSFYGARIQETLETSGVTKLFSQPFNVIDRIHCGSVLF